jgi:hypothetical protein
MTSLGDLLKDEGAVRVIVELKSRPVEPAHLRRLEEIGLVVERVVRDKVIGLVPAEKLAALESDAIVAAVERSVKLKPHS